MTEIINELNENNSTNYKLDVLKKHKDNELLKRVLKMTYDKVAYTYGVTMKNVDRNNEWNHGAKTLIEALNILETELCTRNTTGNSAIELIEGLLNDLSEEDGKILELILGRDLKINIGKTQINKVWKDLITKPTYMRCDVYSDKTSKNIKFPAIVQLKADGTYREFNVQNGHVTSRSRSGEEYEYPVIFEQMKDFPNGIYTGELTVKGINNRAEGNGLINSDNPPHNDIVVELWDYITFDEYNQARLKDRKNPCKKPYMVRFTELKQFVNCDYNTYNNISIIPWFVVDNLQEALKITSDWMSQGFEGSILKDWNGVFKDGTSKQQLKLKLEISAEMRIVGFHKGTKGTKREGKIGSLIFENDEGTIQGKCSGFTDKELDEISENFEKDYLGKIVEVQFNDLSKAKGSNYYALSHPRFIEIRNDKDETDTLEKVFQLREMAIELK